jgi:hypothetical protein
MLQRVAAELLTFGRTFIDKFPMRAIRFLSVRGLWPAV